MIQPGRARVVTAATALAVLVFQAVPATLYLGNLPDFTAAPAPLMQVLLVPVLLIVACAFVGSRFGGAGAHALATSLLSMLTVLAWGQAYLLGRGYGVFDGETAPSAAAWRGWLDASLWITGLLAAVLAYRRLERPLFTAAIVIVSLQIVTIGGDAIARSDALAHKSANPHPLNGLEPMARFSAERNVLHIVLDSFQADVFHELVTGPEGAQLQQGLPGFTYFEEHVGTFPSTHLAMPVIVSGQPYRNHLPLPDYMDQAFGSGSVLRAARNAGFEIDIAADAWMLDMLAKAGVDNAYAPGALPLAHEAARLLDFALFRLAPHFVKPAVYDQQRWRVQRLLPGSDFLKFVYFKHNAFLAEVTRRLAVDRAQPVYKFYHLMTTHRPFVVNPDCSPAGRELPRLRETVTAQSRCSLAFVVALLLQMQQEGVYDNSLIVLMADHGGHVDPLRYRPGHIEVDGKPVRLRPHEVAMATPLLAVKPPAATEPFRISKSLTSMTDVAATIDALMQLGSRLPGRSVLDEPAPAERRYHIYPWRSSDMVSDHVDWIEEFVIAGSVYRAENWHPIAVYFPPGGPPAPMEELFRPEPPG